MCDSRPSENSWPFHVDFFNYTAVNIYKENLFINFFAIKEKFGEYEADERAFSDIQSTW